jgi:predicted lactoylglutathione lyase/predicted flap endonuclease-1-like 5' DNA nuclease
MKQSVSLITLGVADYERAKAFYAALGWSPKREIEETAFFQANGVVLVLWARDKLATDSGIVDDGARWSGIALAHNVASREEVDAVVEQARTAGGTITREPAETFYGGYAAVFRDPDGHAWEIAHNPGFGLGADGSVVLESERMRPSPTEEAAVKLHGVEGIGSTYATTLEAHGLTTIDHLLEHGGTAAGRQALAEKSGISERLILEWVNHADLIRVDGVGDEYADLLEAAGVDSAPELAQRNAANLHARLEEVNEQKSLVRRVPSESEVASWIENAKTLPRVVHH